MTRRLLDVNALVAWEHRGSPHHADFHAWAKRTGLSNLWTCAHVELGFLRVSMQAFDYSLGDAADALSEMRRNLGGFVEAAPPPQLAPWAAAPGRTSDAYLAQVAAANGLRLATFDRGIRDSAVELIAAD